MTRRTLLPAIVLALVVSALPSITGAQEAVYRVLTVQAAPGDLLELIDLYGQERAYLTSIGEEPGLRMRHSQGDAWDLMLVYPIEGVSEYFDREAVAERWTARTADGRTGRELFREIDALTARREELFVQGPPQEEVKSAWAGAGLFHVEIFEGLAGKRRELVRQREMENEYLVALGRKPNHIFTRIAGAAADVFTIGYYDDLEHYASPRETTPERRESAAVAAGFRGADYIGSYLRELILRHHDTLAVAIR